ncbi:MAG: cysteine--tRNA ligase [Candidatus Nealsonbacteria bacterium CG_4_9_14_0_2_um_filter_37_38]|uniref:Cysteine--tRNA ligase n=1 Tax=Candidatus Nealsonbacteria bacterium CG_4_10_14_0_8_um_filter_37_14 TaxID=1974684 RepID=A0A2M7R571_9BACT|nr:MAG: cysteine--tRNA ligase [Candidatus Nealsonbacteria bacterium CG11_big_fil_rev_8_21_14_0_20_37_68]PIW91914.1 MAG: cysteine--tRNA ligase [Candidatus Nealsonbacteria bacterium CG_4_8_14_3_um_filter_37_23]PIY88438.1 MAG: cysteine--tRNA ligase [Candidatus Nealsonbacteria bacterium CG_4_10_14_0_8_um_filter_37_14]PJC51916.1 MAG: cysteine--tRNA ligase [Candidatus Nealsonbacteria bacterium CG_4_9_14_0_2_um_filter_37_38]
MLKIYNTSSRKKENFKPRTKNKVNIFVCGPTVYDYPHIGHARTYIAFDMIVKYLKQKGYNVFYLQNITDVDNKIIIRAKEERTFWKNLARKFEREYLKDMRKLNINSVNKYARATAHIKEIINQVKRLLKNGFAYRIKDGIYYDISKFKDYGKLSGRTVLQAEDAVSRIDEAEEKRNKGDFCLWKKSKPGEPNWKSPWFSGRPGWHIEDTAITEKYFGFQYDIHGGARDLIFPHHEAEIAQMEAISGKSPMVKYWLHSGFLTVKGEKMAKSLGNFITIKDFLKENSPRLLRLFVIKTHYRSPIDYSEKEIEQVKNQLERIDEFVEKFTTYPPDFACERTRWRAGNLQLTTEKRTVKSLILQTKKEFEKAMEDDFNTPKAIASIFELISQGNSLMNKNVLSQTEAKNILEFLKKIDRFFNFIFWKKPKEKISENILKLVEEREKYRKQKNWEKADEVRKEINKIGYKIEDTKKGPKIKPVSID